MKKIFAIIATLALFATLCYAGDVSVKGYYRKDGTYVAPYHRSSPDTTVRNNYDYKGNTNPYTGETGDNYYRNNPTSEYYGTSSSRQTSNYNYDTDSDNRSSSSNYNTGYSLPVVSPSLYGNTRTNDNSPVYSGGRNTNQYGYGSSDSSSSEDSDSEE